MTKWKYRILYNSFNEYFEDDLNDLAKDGWEIFDWEYIKTDRNYTDYDEMIVILRKKLIKVWKIHKNGTGELVKLPRKKKNWKQVPPTSDWDEYHRKYILPKLESERKTKKNKLAKFFMDRYQEFLPYWKFGKKPDENVIGLMFNCRIIMREEE